VKSDRKGGFNVGLEEMRMLEEGGMVTDMNQSMDVGRIQSFQEDFK